MSRPVGPQEFSSQMPDGHSTCSGLDACRGGWAQAFFDEPTKTVSLTLQPSLKVAARASEGCNLLLVDIPIGLPSTEHPSPRRCDLEARHALPGRASSVFPPPAREALAGAEYGEACRINSKVLGRKLSQQCWGICPKIREADTLLGSHPTLQKGLREAHPELCFAYFAQLLALPSPLRHPKRKKEGQRERLRIIQSFTRNLTHTLDIASQTFPSGEAGADDWLDAAALAIAASLAHRGTLRSLPTEPEFDALGLRMEIFGVAAEAAA